MSIFLVGGGPDTITTTSVYDYFVSEAGEGTDAKSEGPRIAVVLFDGQGSGARFLPSYAEPLESRTKCLIRAVYVRPDEQVDPAVFIDVDAILVGGGPTPAYLGGLQRAVETINRAVVAGVPYLGFSAGAMIAPENALIGGYRINGTQICPEEWSERLSDVTLRSGLGLVPFTIDVHAAQAGTLGRAISAVSHGFAEKVVALDEDTALIVSQAPQKEVHVIGSGHAWVITKTPGEPTVSVVASARSVEELERSARRA